MVIHCFFALCIDVLDLRYWSATNTRYIVYSFIWLVNGFYYLFFNQ
uniref:Uncharacterized protein n=1 Tax=Siphoviridae sp. ctcPV5 TaxID=2827582 RepID=A0A8S5LKV2_9CAUD|nr:MAG TPA: hypothetical protein [Siphoviridae sp. ctcPV5]